MIKHYYQTTNFSCVQAAAAMLLSAYDIHKTPDQILEEVKVRSWPGKDEPAGTPNQDIAAYFCKLGLQTEIISFDMWVTDLGWQGKDIEYIKDRLQKASGMLTAPMIGREGTELYIQAYLDYIAAGGTISVAPAPTSEQFIELLAKGPIMTTVAPNALHGFGKGITGPELHFWSADDIKGAAPNHNIVLHKFVGDKIEVYDSWTKPGVQLVDTERLIAAISLAQQECDNMLIVVRRPSEKVDLSR